MTNQTASKIRLVRCPRCRLLLPEPDIPVYKCGGCGAVLQAKNRKTDTKDAALSHDGNDTNKTGELDCVSDQKVINNLNQEATSSAGGDLLPETSNKKNQEDFPDCNRKQPGDQTFCDELPNSPQLSSRANEDLSARVRKQVERAQCEYNSDQDTDGFENEFGDSKRNWSRGRSFSDDFYSSMEFPCHETEDSSPEFHANVGKGESNSTSDHCARMNQNAHVDCLGEQHKDSNFLSKVSLSIEDKLDEHSSKGGTLEERDDSKCVSQHVGCSNESEFKVANSSQETSSSTVVVPEKPSSVVEANSEVDENLGDHVLGSSNTEDSLDKKERYSSDTDESPLNGTIPSTNVDSPGVQQLSASQRMILRGFGHAGSEDALDNLPLVNVSSEFGLKNTNLSKSPTRSYYGDDGSPSSYEGFDNRISGRLSKPPKRKLKHANFNNSNRLQREDGPPANDVLGSNPEMQDQAILGSGSEVQNQARKSSILPDKNHFTVKYKNHQNDLHEPRSYGHSSGSKVREEDKDEEVSRLPFIPKYSLAGRRNGNASHYPYDGFQHYSGFCVSDAPSYTEPNKLELLRMVHELKDELYRMQITNNRFPPTAIREDKYIPLFYDRHAAHLEGLSAELLYSRYPGRYGQGKGLPQLHRIPRVAFSGDAAEYRRHVDCACLRCHPQDWQCSAQLPPHSICSNKVHCMTHSNTCCNGQCSSSSSPQHYRSSEFSAWDCETKSDDQRYRDNEMKRLYLRERYHSAKRHVIPVAGGTPFVACYHCSELLQLPADFLLLGRRCHKLKCCACRKVMKFSLESNTHLTPYTANIVAPPPSMVDDCSESTHRRNQVRQRNRASTSHSIDNPYAIVAPPPSMVDDCSESIRRRRNRASTSHSIDNPCAEPLSCTDDYGLSFDRSYSTEGEPLLITPPLHPVERNSRNRNLSSGNSVMPLDDSRMKSAMGENRKTNTNSVGNLGSVEPLSKTSKWRKSPSEIKELPTSGGSPLHRLMGYSSPSAVMKN